MTEGPCGRWQSPRQFSGRTEVPTPPLTLVRFTLDIVFALLSLCAIGYYLLVLWAARSFRRRARPPQGFTPPVTILKPVRGDDPEAFAAFESHCRQDYPEYELIFGVWDPADAAIAAVERLRQEFPQRAIRLVMCPQALGANRKLSNLVQMLPHARFPYLIVNDSDIRVPPDYLRQIMAPFADSNVGLVTALYRGAPSPTLGSRLESLGISTDFIGGVLAARLLEGGVRFALGSTMAMRADVLARIGGFEPLLDYLADDYELGKRTADAGLRVEIADAIVDTHLPAYSWGEFLEHQLRWWRGIRDSRRAGYLGLAFTFGIPWAVFAVLAAGGAPWAWLLLLAALLARYASAEYVARSVLDDRTYRRLSVLLPLRDLLAMAIWVAGFAGHTVTWRGERFLLKDRKLYRTSSESSAS